MVEQLSVFLENEPGRLARMCRALADAGNNMRVLMVADTAEYGVARVICDRPHAARRALENEGFAVSVTPVIAVRVPDEPGGLADVLESLSTAGVSIEYLYCYVRPDGGDAVDIFRVEDPSAATHALEGAGFSLVRASEIYALDAA
ncbi:MAG TPA: ACT domain-containing protein [Coriobacteriia bacterium]